MFLQMFQQANLKLALVQQTEMSRLYTLYGLVRMWTTKSTFLQPSLTLVLKLLTRRKRKRCQRSQQRRMIKLLTLKRNSLCPKPHFLNVFNPVRRKITVRDFKSFKKYQNQHSFLRCNQPNSFLCQVFKRCHYRPEENFCSS